MLTAAKQLLPTGAWTWDIWGVLHCVCVRTLTVDCLDRVDCRVGSVWKSINSSNPKRHRLELLYHIILYLKLLTFANSLKKTQQSATGQRVCLPNWMKCQQHSQPLSSLLCRRAATYPRQNIISVSSPYYVYIDKGKIWYAAFWK